jgi:hypothetical protein
MDNTHRIPTVMTVTLGAHHLQPGRTLHRITDSSGREFPPLARLEIAQHPRGKECYLFHVCENGMLADTWHRTIGEAMDQAEWEFGVRKDEWRDVIEKVISVDKQDR